MKTKAVTHSEAETAAFAREFAKGLGPGSAVALYGQLGAGKTALVRALCQALGFSGGVSSPTYTLVHEYPHEPPIFHLDLYRLSTGADLEEAGLARCLAGDAIALIEWPERLQNLLGITHLVTIKILSDTAREITVEPHDPAAPR